MRRMFCFPGFISLILREIKERTTSIKRPTALSTVSGRIRHGGARLMWDFHSLMRSRSAVSPSGGPDVTIVTCLTLQQRAFDKKKKVYTSTS